MLIGQNPGPINLIVQSAVWAAGKEFTICLWKSGFEIEEYFVIGAVKTQDNSQSELSFEWQYERGSKKIKSLNVVCLYIY